MYQDIVDELQLIYLGGYCEIVTKVRKANGYL